MDSRQLRSALASVYYSNVHAFLASPDSQSLHALNLALKSVHCDDIVADEVFEPVKLAKRFLISEDRVEGCNLILKLVLMNPGLVWDPQTITQTVEVSLEALIENAQNCMETMHLLTQLVESNRVPEHLVHLASGACSQYIFSATNENKEMSAVCTHFIAVSLITLAKPAREALIQDVLSKWRQQGASGLVLAQLVLEMVLTTGRVPQHVFNDAAAFNSVSALTQLAVQTHNDSVAVAYTVSRKLIASIYQEPRKSASRANLDEFMAFCASKLHSPSFPAAEVVVSAFYSTCFNLTNVYKNEKYYTFLFTVIDVFYDPLKRAAGLLVPSQPDSAETNAAETNAIDKLSSTECVELVSSSSSNDTAAFMASRLSAKFDAGPISKALQVYTPSGTQASDTEWTRYLQQWPISGYFQKTGQFLTKLANNTQLAEKHQVEVFKLISKLVRDGVCVFNPEWMDRTVHASALVCDSLVLVLLLAHPSIASQNELETCVEKVSARAVAPGAGMYKKRLLTLLEQVYSRAPSICWKFGLVCAGDADKQVSSLAQKLCMRFFNDMLQKSNLPLLQALQSENSLTKPGLQAFAKTCNVFNMQTFIGTLLDTDQLELAALLVESNGHFMPPARSQTLLSISGPKTLLYLRMIDGMLLARPRVLLAPKLSTTLFQYLLRKLRVCTDREAEHTASILGQLVGLGNREAQRERLNALRSVALSALTKLDSPVSDTVYCQLVLIASCARFWDVGKELLYNIALRVSQAGLEYGFGQRRLAIIKAVFGLVSCESQLLSLDIVNQLFDSISSNNDELQLFTRLLLQHLWKHKHEKHEVNEYNAVSKHSLLFAIHSNNDSNASMLLTERYFEPVLERAKSGTDLAAIRAVVKAVDEKLVAAEKCHAVIVSCCFSNRAEVSQTAYSAFCSEFQRRPALVSSKFCAGVLSAVEVYKSLDFTVFVRLFNTVYSATSSKPSELIKEIASTLNSASKLEYIEVCVLGLMNTSINTRDAKQLVSIADSNVRIFEPFSSMHTENECVKIALVHTFTLWVRTKHGFSVYMKSNNQSGSDEGPFSSENLITNCAENPRTILSSLLQLPDTFKNPEISRLVSNLNEMDLMPSSDSSFGELGKRADVFAPSARKRVIED